MNWSGSLRFTPGRFVAPESEEALAALVAQASRVGQTVRVVGTGHSSSPLVATAGPLVSLRAFRSLNAYDRERCQATIGAGITLHEAGKVLLSLGMAFANLGDIDRQTVAGAFSTGTHGTGLRLPPLAAQLIGGRLITGSGEVVAFDARDPAVLNAARVSLGALGMLTELQLQLVPAHKLRKRTWCAGIGDCLEHFAALALAHRHVDFYWYPRSDEVKIRTMDPVDAAPAALPFARLLREDVGWSSEVTPNVRELRFEEMEYALPVEHGPACFREVRQRIKARWRHLVGWRVLYRTAAADDALLSPAHGRATATISLHQNATLPFREFFADVEPLLRTYGGRPHWGKHHTLRAGELRPLYPAWDRFLEVRQQLDPGGVFLNDALRELLGVA
ncbi:MAG: FAD-binding protein [Chloroflexota bacterium]|nr:FAD-binding protein [Chloroflexota bacterium]